MPGNAKKNQFQIGDAVAHLSSGQRGLVVETRRDWVRFKVIGEKGTNGKDKFVRFSYRKLVLLATRAQILEGYQAYLQAGNKPRKQPSPWQKFKAWV